MATTSEKLTFSAINCNSLNISDTTKTIQLKKIFGVVKLKTDVIFLSDTRLGNKNLVNCTNDVNKQLRLNPYRSYVGFFNSSRNCRGTGILIAQNLVFSVIEQKNDPGENYILLKVELRGNIIILGAVYGPNKTDPNFFASLANDLRNMGDYPTVIGGDWNATYSSNPIETNIDCYNMQQLPNLRHTLLLIDICNAFAFQDPYRLLNPNRKDYTYVPRAANATNKSRIDFFLTNLDVYNDSQIQIPFFITDCDIAQTLQSRIFDHKAIILELNGITSGPTIRSPTISHNYVNDELMDPIVKLAICETYLHHTGPASLETNNKLRSIGRCKKLIRDAGLPLHMRPESEINPDTVEAREALIELINELAANLDMDNLLENVNLTDPGSLLEIILNNIRNEVVSYQTFMSRSEKFYIANLKTQISNLKNETLPNYEDKLRNLETKLLSAIEAQLNKEIQKFRLFEQINHEKITPRFLQLAKATKKEHRLSDIKDDNGNPFNSDQSRNDYIRNYYANIYKTKPDREQITIDTVPDFLGPDITNNPILTQSKLNLQEKDLLENPITVAELDIAIEKCKSKTACGPDGIGNFFLKKYWKYLRIPVLNYANYCFTTGSLTPSFKTASIKLIPKKGDTTKLKNWRPISLLNCTYKIISKTLDIRLSKVTDKILSRAQKGFTGERHIQEVLINVIETIAKCNYYRVPAVVAAIDQSKAFDSIDHQYLRDVYRFFGFGNQFISMMRTITENRNACIKLDNGSLTENFPLETGAPQGNSPSPRQYNLCQQICIFKIELDPEIASVFTHMLVPRPLAFNNNQLMPLPLQKQENPKFLKEIINKTDKVEAFADDGTSIFQETENGLAKLTQILSDFGKISGLITNFEKS